MLSPQSLQHLLRFAQAVARATGAHTARAEHIRLEAETSSTGWLSTLPDMAVGSDREHGRPAPGGAAPSHGAASPSLAGFFGRIPWSRRVDTHADAAPEPATPAQRLAVDLLRSAPWSRRGDRVSIPACSRSAQVLPFQSSADRRPGRDASGANEPAGGLSVEGFFARLPWRGRPGSPGAPT